MPYPDNMDWRAYDRRYGDHPDECMNDSTDRMAADFRAAAWDRACRDLAALAQERLDAGDAAPDGDDWEDVIARLTRDFTAFSPPDVLQARRAALHAWAADKLREQLGEKEAL